jgi:site-specific DNA recombinase
VVDDPEALRIVHTVPMSIRRRGVGMRLVIGDFISTAKADPALVKAIARGRSWWSDLASGVLPSIPAIAKRDGVSDGYVSQLLPLAFLAPSVVEAIINGDHPADLTAETLVKRIDLPLAWDRQRALLGCG